MTDRGRQSWGWSNGTDIHKKLGEVRSSFTDELLGHNQAIIHTRHATFGAQVAENSHPFAIKGIIGVHNGIIHNHKAVAAAHNIEYAVDSEVIFHRIADGGDLSELEGYGAVAFWKDGVFHIGRFNNGDMALAATEFGWAFASTGKALADALGMAGLGPRVKYQPKLKEGTLYQLIDDKIVRSDIRLNISKSSNKTTWQSAGSYRQPFTEVWDPETKKWVAKSTMPTITSASTTYAEYMSPQPDYGSLAWYKKWPQSKCCVPYNIGNFAARECFCRDCKPALYTEQALLPLPTSETTTFRSMEDDFDAEDARVEQLLDDAWKESRRLEQQMWAEHQGDEYEVCYWCNEDILEGLEFDGDVLCASCYAMLTDEMHREAFLREQEEQEEDLDPQLQFARMNDVTDSFDLVTVNWNNFGSAEVFCSECTDNLMDNSKVHVHRTYRNYLLCESCHEEQFPRRIPTSSAIIDLALPVN